MSVKLSFVLPCYNVDRYIADCLESIFAQEMPESEYEVICVNDCSTDNTRSVIVEYQKEHPNLFHIDHLTNLTSGGARNTGIEASHGEYIWFVDPDDMIMQGSCDYLLCYAEKEQPDIVMFNNRIVNEEGAFVKDQIVFSNIDCCQGQDFIESYFPSRMSDLCIVWRCLFRRSFLIDFNLRYPQIRKSQDVVFLWKCLLCAGKLTSCDGIFYCYRRNPHSVANLSKNAQVTFSERILFGNEVNKILNNNASINDCIRKCLKNTLYWCANDNIGLLVKMSQEEITKYYSEMKIHNDAVLSVRQFMNRKNKWLYRNNWSAEIWKVKIKILSLFDKWMK